MRKGFTLTELLVIISIIGVLVATTWPLVYPAQKRTKVKLAAQRVADFLRSAQEQTLAEQDIFGVRFDTATNVVTLVNYGESYEGVSDEAQVVESKNLDEGSAFVSTTLIDPQKGVPEVRFTKTGTPSITGTATIGDSAGSSNSSWLVEVAPSGLVKVYQ